MVQKTKNVGLPCDLGSLSKESIVPILGLLGDQIISDFTPAQVLYKWARVSVHTPWIALGLSLYISNM